MNKHITFWLAVFGALFFISSVVLGGLQFETYSHIRQYISESYAFGTPYGVYLRFLGYIPSGLFFILFTGFAWRILPKSKLTSIGLLGFGVFYGLGTIIVGIFPCDTGCNKNLIDPSLSQIIHNVFGALMYFIVPFCLLIIGWSARSWKYSKKFSILSLCFGITAFVFSMLLTNDPTGPYIGLFQRITETVILIWLINFAFYIKNYKNQ